MFGWSAKEKVRKLESLKQIDVGNQYHFVAIDMDGCRHEFTRSDELRMKSLGIFAGDRFDPHWKKINVEEEMLSWMSRGVVITNNNKAIRVKEIQLMGSTELSSFEIDSAIRAYKIRSIYLP